MKEFITAAEAVVAEDDENQEEGLLEFQLTRQFPPNPDGSEREPEVREMVAHKPGDGQLAVLMATTSSLASGVERVAGSLNFLVSVLDEEDHAYIVSRLYDRHDQFGVKEVTDILHWMIEEWTGRPTDGPSASAPSRKTGGRKSTRRTPALTS